MHHLLLLLLHLMLCEQLALQHCRAVYLRFRKADELRITWPGWWHRSHLGHYSRWRRRRHGDLRRSGHHRLLWRGGHHL